MDRYRNNSRQSNIASYEIGSDYILIKFNGTSKAYKYSYRKAGQKHIENMKILAKKGSGLNGYINSNVKFLYD